MSEHNLGTEMTKELITVEASRNLADAYNLMFTNKIRHLPVVDSKGVIIGLISERDIQRAMQSEVGEQFGFKTEKIEFKDDIKVQDYMVWPVRSFDVSSDIKLVINKMLETKVSSFLIKDGDQVVGIITTDDFLQLLHRVLDEDGERESYRIDEVLDLPLFGQSSYF